jgi:undecaprenyl-diphosphatase
MSAFSGLDLGILSLLHTLSEHAGWLLTPLAKLVTLLGEKGILFFLLSLVLMCFAKTRPLGVCIFGAVCCGALITNILLKDWVARPRPFETLSVYRDWWQSIGSPAEDGFSFPSGHVTAAAAGMVSLCLSRGKKWIWPTVAWVLLMAISRNYLMAHYPSDVLCAALIGTASAFIAWAITQGIYRLLKKYEDVPFCTYVLDFDVRDLRAASYRGKH